MVDTLRGCTHQAFPVTPDTDKAFESAEPFDLHGTYPRNLPFYRPQLQALTRRAWTHGCAVKPVCALLSLCAMSAQSALLLHCPAFPFKNYESTRFFQCTAACCMHLVELNLNRVDPSVDNTAQLEFCSCSSNPHTCLASKLSCCTGCITLGCDTF